MITFGRHPVSMVAMFGVLLMLQCCASHSSQSSSVNSFVTQSTNNDSDGLEVIRWTTTNDTSKLEGVVVGFQIRPVMNPIATEALMREGFIVAIVDMKDLPTLREKLGSSAMDIRASYGALPNWREVFKRTIPNGQAIASNGRPHMFNAQMLQIAARGWSTPTESGGCFQLEIVTTLLPVEKEQSAQFARADRPAGTSLNNTAVELCLQPNEVLIMLCANTGPFKSGRGPGSEAPLPPTAGQFLLGESADLQGSETFMKGVTLLAFVPHMPSDIVPARNSAAALSQ